MATVRSVLASAAHDWHTVTGAVSHAARAVNAHADPALVAALVVAAVAFFGIALLNLRGGSGHALKAALRPYEVHEQPNEPVGENERPSSPLRRMLMRTADVAARRALRDALNERLERAGISIPTGEFLMLWAGATVLLGVLAGMAVGAIGGVVAVAIALLLPLAVIDILIDRRRRQFAAQIPHVLELLAASIRAGFSLLQSLSAIVDQVAEPMASELRVAFAATRFGTPVEDALEGVAARTFNRDFAWAVTAIRIQRTVGGNLAEILDTVAATMTERDRLRHEVRMLTAEGRVSALVVGLLPFGLAGLIFAIDRSYLMSLLHNLGGELAIGGGLLLELAGAWWLYRIVHIDS